MAVMNGRFITYIKSVLGLKSEREVNKSENLTMVSLSAWWGNADVFSDIVIQLSKWEEILNGLEFETDGYSWYEGERFNVTWQFNKEYSQSSKGYFTIFDDDDGGEYIRNQPLSNINVLLMDGD